MGRKALGCAHPLVDFMRSSGYEGAIGSRERYLYAEGAMSPNNISWIQHELEEKSIEKTP